MVRLPLEFSWHIEQVAYQGKLFRSRWKRQAIACTSSLTFDVKVKDEGERGNVRQKVEVNHGWGEKWPLKPSTYIAFHWFAFSLAGRTETVLIVF